MRKKAKTQSSKACKSQDGSPQYKTRPATIARGRLMHYNLRYYGVYYTNRILLKVTKKSIPRLENKVLEPAHSKGPPRSKECRSPELALVISDGL